MSEEKLVEPGYYDLKVKSFGANCTGEKKTPKAWVKFDNGLFWQGYWTDKTAEKTSEQLVTLGFSGNTLDDMNKEDALEVGKEVSCAVEHNTWDGKTTARVAWINAPYQKKELDPTDAKVLQGVDVRGFLKEARKKLGEDLNVKSILDAQKKVETNQDFAGDDIPF